MKRKRKTRPKIEHVYKNYKNELQIFILFILGTFLVVEDYDIKGEMFKIGFNIILFFRNILLIIILPIFEHINKIEASDIIGYLLILYALFLVYRSIRIKFNEIYAYKNTCPSCDGKLQRIHKLKYHRIIENIFFIDIKHFKCENCKKSNLFVA
jgi:hypothetical protein